MSKFKPGDKVFRIPSELNSDRYQFTKDKIYTVLQNPSEDTVFLEEYPEYGFYPPYFISAEPELFHQQLESLSND